MNFSINDLVTRINEIFEEDPGMNVTKADIQKPTSDFVQRFVFNFLREFGFSENMLQSQTCVDLHAGNLSNDIADTLNLDILVVASRKFFQRINFRDANFGIFDLVEPDPKVISLWTYLN